MVKFRSMIIDASASGVDSTASDDKRITTIGRIVRKFKIDEIPQLFNVMIGDMSFVGPRPNVESETRMYSKVEQRILSVKPGITDFSSIVFSDEGDILKGSDDPDLKYNQIIRPWKSRLALLYIDNRTLMIDIKIIINLMKTKNIPTDIKSKSLNETKLEISKILERLENNQLDLETSREDYERLLTLNNHIDDLFREKLNKIRDMGIKK